MSHHTYAQAGVDIDEGQRVVEVMGKLARTTHRPEVLTDIGLFAGLFELKGFQKAVLVASTDGVGTKLNIASILRRYDTVGIDLVHHCVNDILTTGAEPLFFLDYIAMGRLEPEVVNQVGKGLAEACREVGCALLGGETAEMPGTYAEGQWDLAGFMVGAVEREKVIDGRSIQPGDVLVGLPSSGLHTNGYSLVRKVFGIADSPAPLEVFYPELGQTLGEELMVPHRCYYPLLKDHLSSIKGMAHITGGGLSGNVPRILPPGLAARFRLGSWEVPPIFSLIQSRGRVDEEEMFRVYNMGLGMVLVGGEGGQLLASLPTAQVVGEVVRGEGVIFER